MTEAELDELARRCLSSAIEAFETHDAARLADGRFTPLMRGALERLIERTPMSGNIRAGGVDWATYKRAGVKRFSDLQAQLHEFTMNGKPMVQLTATNRSDEVCDFAYLEDVTKLDRPYLKNGAGLQSSPWFNVAMFALHYKMDALGLISEGFTFSTRRLGDNMNATFVLPQERALAMTDEEKDQLLETLVEMTTNAQRLMWDRIKPKTVHVILIAAPVQEKGRASTVFRPPIDQWLADRMVKIPD